MINRVTAFYGLADGKGIAKVTNHLFDVEVRDITKIRSGTH